MKKNILLTFIASMCAVCAWAYDFNFGDLYYNITSDSTVEVTSPKTWSPDNYSGLTSATIPESVTYNGTIYSVTSIGDMAFSHCTGLTSVTIPNSVTSIGSWAFSRVCNIVYSGTATGSPWGARSVNGYVDGYLVYSDAIKTTLLACSSAATGAITVPNSVTSIGDNAFLGCAGLTYVTIPNSVTSIGEDAFRNCTGLTSVAIPNSVTNVGGSAFNYVPNIVYSGTATGSPWGARSVNGYVEGCLVYSDAAKTTLLACSSTATGTITVPNSVTSIGDNAFLGCAGLTYVTIPNSVTSIGEDAFFSCGGLTSIKVESGNAVYDSRNNCNAIIETATNTLVVGCRNTTIPNSVTSIGDDAFYDCSGLTSITIPNSVTSIGKFTFYRCSGLTSITIPNSVTSIGVVAFAHCTGLTSVTIGNSVTSIGSEAFSDCTGLASVTIGNGVTTIGYNAFAGCRGLTSITIPNSVTSIEWGAFSVCTGLTSVTCYAIEPPTVVDNSFSTVYVGFIPLYVPAESVEKYKAAEVWKEFMEILPIQNTAIDQPTQTPTNNSVQSRKVFRNGQVLILRGDKTYTLTGEEVK